MKKFFILLMVVLMLVGLTFSSFAGQGSSEKGFRNRGASCDVCPDPDCPNPDCPNK